MAAGVGRLINPGIDLASSERAVQLAEEHPEVYAAVGVHPNDCGSFAESDIAALHRLAGRPKVVAIGEVGLDFYWKETSRQQQERALWAQLELTAELQLPVILHSRESHAELLGILRKWCNRSQDRGASGGILGVWHAFSGDFGQAEEACDLGLMLGLGGPLTYRNAGRLRELAPQLRRDRLVLETDSPYLAPMPFRGKRNEPANLPLIADALGALFGVESGEIVAASDEAIARCFDIGDR